MVIYSESGDIVSEDGVRCENGGASGDSVNAEAVTV